MENHNERETKELELGVDNPTPKPENNNSFYDRTAEKKQTVWHKDWRGKTLAITLASLVLLGAGIPSGMAITGYFKNVEIKNYNSNENTVFDDAKDEVERIKDQAIIKNFDKMKDEGWITESKWKSTKKDLAESADKTIRNQKDSLEKKYGNTWKEEWDKSLQEKGFHISSKGGEQEYKDSIISDGMRDSQISTYKSINTITDHFTKDVPLASDVVYASDLDEQGSYYVISNKDGKGKLVTDSFTSQDLMTLYLMTFEPIVYNRTRMAFTPSDSSGSGSIAASQLTVTTDDMKNMVGFYRALDSFEPAAEIFGGIQSKHNINVGETVDNVSLNMFNSLSEVSKSKFDLKTATDNAFEAAIADASELNITGNAATFQMSDIEKLGGNTKAVDAFEISLYNSLNGAELLTTIGDAPRDFVQKTTLGPKDYALYVGTTGLNFVGTQLEGNEIVKEQLNFKNGVYGSKVDYGLFSSYSSWLSSNYENILLIDMFTDVKDAVDGESESWFNYGGPNPTLNLKWKDNEKEEDKEIWKLVTNKKLDEFIVADQMASSTTSAISAKYKEAADFYDQNWQIFDNSGFKTKSGNELLSWLEESNVHIAYKNVVDSLLPTTTVLKQPVVIKEGDL